MWTFERSGVTYAGVVTCLCLGALVGMWLPWVTPEVVYISGEPTVIAIGLYGRGWGYNTGDEVIVVSITLAIAASLVFERSKWLRDALVFLSGVAMSL